MSFPKAKMKRFNDVDGDSAPPVGAYDPKLLDKTISAPFTKSTRFKNSDQDLSDGSTTSDASSTRTIRPQNSAFKVPKRTRSFSSTIESAKLHECEKEIKRLLNERSDLMKQLSLKEGDLKKLDNKLQAALREKTSLKASLVSFERENKCLQRLSETLTMKLNIIQTGDRKKDHSVEILSLSEQLLRKGHEISDLRAEITKVRSELEEATVAIYAKDDELNQMKNNVDEKVGEVQLRLKAALTELHELKSSHLNLEENSDKMHDQVHSLMETIFQNEVLVAQLQTQKSELLSDLSACQKELETRCTTSAEMTEALRRENLVLLSRVEETTGARQRDARLMTVQLDNANQKLQSTEDCSRALQEYRDALVCRVATLKESIAELEDQQMTDLCLIKEMKVEILNATSQLNDKEKALMAANSEITSLKEEVNELQKCKLELMQLSSINSTLEKDLESYSLERESLQGELLVIKLAMEAAQEDFTESKTNLNDVKASLEEQTAELVELKNEINIKESDFDEKSKRLQNEIQLRELTISELNMKIEETLQQYGARCEELKAVIASETAMKSNFDLLEESLQTKNEQIINLKIKLDTKTVEKQFIKVKLETENKELGDQLKTELKFHASMEQQTVELHRLIEEYEEKLVNLTSKYEFDVSDANAYIECLWSELFASQMELKFYSGKLSIVEEERAALVTELEVAKLDIASMSSECATSAALITEKMQLVSQLELSVDNNKEKAMHLEETIVKHENKIELLLSDNQAKELLVTSLTEKIATIEMELSLRESQLVQFDEDKIELKNDLKATNTELEWKRNETAELQLTVDTNKNEIIALTETVNGYETKLKDLHETFETKAQEVNELSRDVNDLHCTLKAQSVVLTEKEAELKIANDQLDIASSEFEKVKIQICGLEFEKRILAGRVDSLSIEQRIANENIAKETAERIVLNDVVQAKQKEILDLENRVCEADGWISSMKRQENDWIIEKERLQEDMRANKMQLDSALKKLQDCRVDNDKLIATLRDDLRRIEAAKHNAEMMFMDAKNIRNLLHDELRKAQRELQESEAKVESSEKTIAELTDLVGELRQLEAMKDNDLQEAREMLAQLEMKVSTQDSELKQLSADVTEKASNIVNFVEEVYHLKAVVNEKETEIDDLKVVVENNQQLMLNKTVIDDLTRQLNDLSKVNQEHDKVIETLRQQEILSEERDNHQKREIQRHSANMVWYKDREKELLKELELNEDKSKAEQQELKKAIVDLQKKMSTLDSQHNLYKEEKEKEGQENEELLQSLTNEYEKKLKTLQEKNWRKLYEDLQSKVEPFMRHIDAYEIERNVLLSKNRETKSELEKLSEQYATLLGHQNHRQKIHYVTKLKEESLNLKEENTKLWTEVLKYRKMMPRRDYGMGTPAGRRIASASASASGSFVHPLDSTSKTYKHPSDKENASPLRDRNII